MHDSSANLLNLANHLESIAGTESCKHGEKAAISPEAMTDSAKLPLQSPLESSGSSPSEYQSSTGITTKVEYSLTLNKSLQLADEFNFGTANLMMTATWPTSDSEVIVPQTKKRRLSSGRVLTITQSYYTHINPNEIDTHPSPSQDFGQGL
jgi:hypothetical protein